MFGKRPEYLYMKDLTDEIIKEKMQKEYDVYENLSAHLLWGHPQIDVVQILMNYIISEIKRNEHGV